MAGLISKPFHELTEHKRGLAFIRLGDGEMMLMFGTAINGIDGWSWAGGPSRLGQDLREALRHPKHLYNA
ncbi:unnamed protein product, partial [Rotaria sordida]